MLACWCVMQLWLRIGVVVESVGVVVVVVVVVWCKGKVGEGRAQQRRCQSTYHETYTSNRWR